jgi:hypothetical protein
MKPLITIAIKREPGRIPESGFYHVLYPIPVESDAQAHSLVMNGYKIIDLDPRIAENLLREACVAHNHQVHLAAIIEEALKGV